MEGPAGRSRRIQVPAGTSLLQGRSLIDRRMGEVDRVVGLFAFKDGHGMATYHQSQISQWADCPAKVGYQLAGMQQKQNSFLAYGSVIHHAVEVMERLIADAYRLNKKNSAEFWHAYNEAIEAAVTTFTFTWSPQNIETVCDPVPEDGWARGHGYSELRSKGVDSLRKYGDLLRFDDHHVLATEFGFNVPIAGTWDDDLGEPHRLAGTVDRLAVRSFRGVPAVACDDWKTGTIPKYLRHYQQLTAYAMASETREFWVGDRGEDGFGEKRGEELYQRFLHAGRRATWISLKTFKFVDAGWRGPIDYQRFALAVSQVHASIQAGIFPLSISGERCRYCEFRRDCAGIGVAPENHGDPRELAPA